MYFDSQKNKITHICNLNNQLKTFLYNVKKYISINLRVIKFSIQSTSI